MAVAIATVWLGGCRGASKPEPSKEYPVRGVIVSVNATKGSIELNAETIPGFMEAMEMSYALEDKTIVSELHPGDKITATLAVDHDAAGPVNMRLRNIVVIAQARPDYKPVVQYHVPAAGDEVPDFALLNQTDKKISLKQFRGKVLLMTFVYTRCTLTTFCLRMSQNFAEIDKALAADPALYAKTHLLSVSFDPGYDTPKVLRSYGEAYTGKYAKETFAHWDFAAPTEQELPKMEQFFDLGVTKAEDGTLQHSLSTVVIGKDGKVVAFYPTNDWAIGTVLAEIRKAA
jgi:protein SCO1/2